MRFGVIHPTTELPAGRKAVREWALAAKQAGFEFLQLYDHTVLVDPAVGGSAFYTRDQPFHEPLVLGGYLAAVTDLEISTGVLVLPQRQTVLVAKQSAELDILTDGKLRLGIGVGWAEVEYQALGASFSDRGVRVEEQIALLRALWTGETIDFSGDHHTIKGSALVPAPTRPDIPIWIGGGGGTRVLERVGRLGDGWMPNKLWRDYIDEALPAVKQAASDAGRDPNSIGLQGLIEVPAQISASEIESEVEHWRSLGACHVSFLGTGAGRNLQGHVEMLEELQSVVPDLGQNNDNHRNEGA